MLLVDDHALFRAGIKLVLESAGYDVVGEAGDGEAALRAVAELEPDIVLMDVDMPRMGGVEATERLSLLAPLVRVVVLTMSATEGDVADAIMAGAAGYLLKTAQPEELTAGIRAVAAGEPLISPGVAGHLLRRVRAGDPLGTRGPGRALSERELDVLRLVAKGLDNGQIGAELYLSPKTVKNHVSSILRKLQMENRIEAAVYAAKRGLV